MSENGRMADVRRIRGKILEAGMTLLDAGDRPRQILEISEYKRHAHPEVPDYRMARCPGDLEIMVFDQDILRISESTSNSERERTKTEDPK